ncbi:hypothetical protein ECTW07793_3832 [Escherichia coli TW07793]|nr:hypothetical protein ECTW07793_3832 [Escherichia coli TW07793]
MDFVLFVFYFFNKNICGFFIFYYFVFQFSYRYHLIILC